ncbi:MAG: hypothetical protein JHC34_01040 [Acidobacteria bacterium]|jgi:Tfp pilus assembly protein PilO|nr:hypothetical protein [Acidobacteriota bacterium]
MNVNIDALIRKGFVKAAVAALAVLLLNIFVYFFGIARLGSVTASQKREIETNSQKIKELEAQRDAASEKASVYRQGSKVLQTLGSDYFKTRAERFAPLQKDLQKILEANGLSNDNIAYSYGEEPKDAAKASWRHAYIIVQIPLAVSGSYPQVKKFIADLEASPQFYVVEDVSLSASTQGAVLLNARLALKTLFLADGEIVAKDEGAKSPKKEAS